MSQDELENEDTITTPPGLQYTDTAEGDGEAAQAGNNVPKRRQLQRTQH